MRPISVVSLVGLVACREPPPPTHDDAASIASAPQPPAAATEREPSPTAPAVAPPPAATPTGLALLPSASEPFTLQHARTLAGREAWPESAAVYTALLETRTDDPRLLSGRGYALSSWGEPAVVDQALSDFERARELTDDARLSSVIAFNLGNLHERLGHRVRAREHYARARSLQGGGAVSHALNRVDDGARHPYDGPTCTLHDAVPTRIASSWVEALAQLRELQGLPRPRGIDDSRAQQELCGGECPSGGVVSRLGSSSDPDLDHEETLEAHVLVSTGSRIVMVPQVARGMGDAARCPDELIETSVDRWHGWSRARISMLTSTLTDCDPDGDDECMPGCTWLSRTDYVVLVPESGSEAVVLEASLAFRDPDAEVPWEWLERYPVLPPGVLHADEDGLHVHGCGLTRDVSLPS